MGPGHRNGCAWCAFLPLILCSKQVLDLKYVYPLCFCPASRRMPLLSLQGLAPMLQLPCTVARHENMELRVNREDNQTCG